MSYNRVVISSGHGLKVRGAAGVLDEVDEARLLVEKVADNLLNAGISAVVFHDDVSTTQNENLNRIVDFHNALVRDLDISVHFNAYVETDGPMGTEVLYLTQADLATRMSEAIAVAGGFINRGPKKRPGDSGGSLFFLDNTSEPSILIETCFVDSETDAKLYRTYFDLIAETIGDVIAGDAMTGDFVARAAPLFTAQGPCSYFGGPDDMGVAPDEGLAFIYEVDQAPYLFLPTQPEGTTGLARRLNPYVHYVACRWDYSVTPKETLLESVAIVTSRATGRSMLAFPADWGPNAATGRVADLSPSLLEDLGLETDDEVEVVLRRED